jgi:toxin ParE1/3/4
MGKAFRAPKSRIDIWNIVDRIAQDNLDAAINLLAEFDRAIDDLARFPGMGPARDEIKPGLRSYPVGSYLLLYRIVPGGIEVVRVFHGMRDIDEDLVES